MRGFLGGIIFGLAAVIAGAAALSLMSPLPPRPDVSADAPQAGPGAAPGGDSSGVDGAGRDADLVEAAPEAPGEPAGGRDDLSSLDDADTAPAEKPAVGAATDGMKDPSTPPEGAEVAPGGDAPVAPQAPAGAPAAPQPDADVAVTPSQPTQPEPPAMSETGSGFGATLSEPEPAPDMAARSDSHPAQSDPAAPVGEPRAEAAPTAATDPAAPPEAAARPEPAPGDASVADTAPPPAGPAKPPAEESQTLPRVAALPQAGDEGGESRPGIGTQVVPLTEREAPAEPQAAPQVPAIEAFAAPFDDPGDKPLMAIVLIDDDRSLGVEALSELGFPISVAIDPAAPDAAEKMARHRAAGREVVALADLPAAASARDAEVSLAVWLDTLGQSVALLEGDGPGIQGSRELSDQVTAIADAAGRGLIFRDNGLNTAQKLAARDGVPSAVLFRDFDGAGQSPTVMRRFLDQAAFRAGQQGAVIMLGRVRPDTISALALWGLQDRAERVALAPVSAVLTRRAAEQ
ncbi:MAG: divergent polysaccharide deacetylase family protein [Rhodobacteraceae bacterium]|nr:divergent polysaccharide deacetylase family protein [Paracoccaceae bacterium]